MVDQIKTIAKISDLPLVLWEDSLTDSSIEQFEKYSNFKLVGSARIFFDTIRTDGDLSLKRMRDFIDSTENQTIRANSENGYIRSESAGHRNSSASTLAKLSYDTECDVRIAVAQNRNTDNETLARLALDTDVLVREGVADNHNTDVDTLIMLTNDADRGTANVAGYNPTLLAVSTSTSEREDAAMKTTNISLLGVLSKDEDFGVRVAVLHNPNTPKELSRFLMDSEDLVGALEGFGKTAYDEEGNIL